MCVPKMDALLASGGRLVLERWKDHLLPTPYPHHADYVALDGKMIDRSLVFAHFEEDSQKGITSAIKWGYPKGKLRRGMSQGFGRAFRSKELVVEVEELRKTPDLTAPKVVRKLNKVVAGIGTSTTTKIAYFSGLSTKEGPCLIYDSMVRRAIRVRSDPEFADLRKVIAREKDDLPVHKQASTYGDYLTATHAMADRLGVRGEQVELFLFIGRDNAAALSLTP
jgi:hypothetical protein